MATTGQTINDRLNAVRYALAGQGLARTVCKATTEEVLGPKKKHMDYLLACTEEPNVSIPQLANLLIDRTQHTSWAVVFKSLITIHHLLNYGNERFTQYLATSNHSFELNDFMDRTTPQGYNMSTFVRRYAKYVSDKIISYKTLAIDLCKIKPGKDNALRTMNMENLTKTLPVVHTQFDSLLDFDIEAKDLNNGIIMAAFKLLYKDLNRIFAAYQEAIINLVERYFNLSRKKAREALSLYKKYLTRMDKVASFFKVVEQVGLDKNEMPDTSKLTSLLGVFEAHLAKLEAKKRGTTPSSPPDEATDGDERPEVSPEKETTKPEQAPAPKKPEPPAASPQEPERKSPSGSKKVEPPSSSSQPSATSAVTKKQPPARPSPIVSPKVSPSKPKPPPGTSSAVPAAAAAPEKKAPPERPAKPPSRPPPPSATPPAPATSTSVASPSPPPPHPPPPHPQPPVQRAQSPPAPEPTATASDDSPAEAASAAHHEGNGASDITHIEGSNHSADGDAASSAERPDASNGPACSGSDAITEEVDSVTAQLEANHVSTNNVENNHVDGLPNGSEPPPPPPPIEEAAPSTNEPPADEDGNGASQEAQVAPNNDLSANQEQATPPPPPPPPPPAPIEE